MVRVLHIVTNLDLGGAQTSVTDICAELRRRGTDVHLAYSSRGGRAGLGSEVLKQRLSDADVPLHDVPEMLRPIHPVRDWAALRGFRSLLREVQPTVVHTHMSKAGAIGRLAAVMERVPRIMHTVRGWSFYVARNPVKRRMMVSIERALARRTHRMFSVTEQMIRDGLAWRIGSADRYTVVRSGIRIRDFESNGCVPQVNLADLGIPEDVPVVGSVMGLSRQKAPLDFVASCAIVAREVPDAHFLVVGDGPLRADMCEAIDRAGLRDRFHLTGLRRDVPSMLRLMDVFLLTSHWEGLARVLMEAAAAGVPTVATDVGGARDLIDHGASGFVAPAGRIDLLAAHVLTLLTDSAIARRMAATAGERLTEEFDLSAAVTRHENVYNAIAAELNGDALPS